MGLVSKSFLVIILILLVFVLIKLTFNTNFIGSFFVERTEKLFYIFELEKKYETKVSIIKKQNSSELFLGVTSDNLEFGVLSHDTVSKRFLNLANDDEMDYKILLITTGNISPMVKFDRNDFILHEGETVKITVSLDPSLASNLGNYTGEISVISKKPKFSFLYSLMGDSE